MESTALAIDHRHLTLPDFCLFAPTELQIGPSVSQNEFSRLGKALSAVDQASDLWSCDYALAGQKRWGDEGLKVAAAATRLSVAYLKVGARIAERFGPSRRFPNMTREHYRGLVAFPIDFTDKWLPTVADKGFGAKTLRALAVEAFGRDPKAGYSKNKKRQVSIPETLYARLKECSPIPKTAVFIEQILSDFANNATPEQQARVAAALITRDADRTRERRGIKPKKAKKPKPEKIQELADVQFQLKKFQESSRPTYAERRQEQIENGAAPIPAKDRKYKCKVRIVFTECLGNTYLDGERGVQQLSGRNVYVSRYSTQEKAEAAAAEYGADRGYPCEAFICKPCSSALIGSGSGYRKEVWHVRARSAPVSHQPDSMAQADAGL
jgi:hypothetical protein